MILPRRRCCMWRLTARQHRKAECRFLSITSFQDLGRALGDAPAAASAAGVVDQNVDAAEGGQGLLDHALHRGLAGDVGGNADGLTPQLADFIHHRVGCQWLIDLLRGSQVNVVDDDVGAQLPPAAARRRAPTRAPPRLSGPPAPANAAGNTPHWFPCLLLS